MIPTYPNVPKSTRRRVNVAWKPNTVKLARFVSYILDLFWSNDNKQTAPNTDLIKRQQTNKQTAPNTDLIKRQQTNKQTAPNTDLIKRQQTNKQTAPNTDLIKRQQTNKQTAPNTDLLKTRFLSPARLCHAWVAKTAPLNSHLCLFSDRESTLFYQHCNVDSSKRLDTAWQQPCQF